MADLLTRQAVQFGREYVIEVGIGIPAQRRIARHERDVVQIVQTAKQIHLAELGDPGHLHKAQIGIGLFDRAVQVFQALAHCQRYLAVADIVEDRFIVFIN